MEKKSINLCVIGFVDHGKSTFINALTDQVMDTHSFEKQRKITIKLGYAKFVTSKYDAYIIDTPGHEMLTTIMLTSLAIADIPLIVVSMAELDGNLDMSDKFLSLISAYQYKLVIIVASKIDTLTIQQSHIKLKELQIKVLKYLKKQQFKILPFSFYSKKFKTLLESYLDSYELADNKTSLKGMYCFRSFDINKPGIKLSELQGGVLGGNLKQGILKVNTKICLYNSELKINLTVLKIIKDGEDVQEIKPSCFFTILTDLDPSLCASDKLAYSYLTKFQDSDQNLSLKKDVSLKLTKSLRNLDKKAMYCLIIKHIAINAELKNCDSVIKFNLEKAVPFVLLNDKVIITIKTQNGWQIKDVSYVVN